VTGKNYAVPTRSQAIRDAEWDSQKAGEKYWAAKKEWAAEIKKQQKYEKDLAKARDRGFSKATPLDEKVKSYGKKAVAVSKVVASETAKVTKSAALDAVGATKMAATTVDYQAKQMGQQVAKQQKRRTSKVKYIQPVKVTYSTQTSRRELPVQQKSFPTSQKSFPSGKKNTLAVTTHTLTVTKHSLPVERKQFPTAKSKAPSTSRKSSKSSKVPAAFARRSPTRL
jgi:hypothetical protein